MAYAEKKRAWILAHKPRNMVAPEFCGDEEWAEESKYNDGHLWEKKSLRRGFPPGATL